MFPYKDRTSQKMTPLHFVCFVIIALGGDMFLLPVADHAKLPEA